MEFKRRRPMKKAKIEIIPMIDTMFFLLVFFMLSSLAMSHMYGLNLQLPKASTSAEVTKVNLTITIDRNNNVFVNNQHVLVPAVAGALQKAAGKADMANQNVVINADGNVPHGLVVECMDEARQAGAEHFAIATTAPGS